MEEMILLFWFGDVGDIVSLDLDVFLRIWIWLKFFNKSF